MKKLEFHPSLKDAPMMPLHERDALATNIEKRGQIVPIVLLNGKIIDGRNRYLACISRNIEPKTVAIVLSGDPKEYVESMNYFRKHWTTGERAHFAALMSMDSDEGRPEKTASNEAVSQPEAAKAMGVSRSSVQRAKAKIQGKPKPETKQSDNGQIVDVCGREVPTEAMSYWNRKSEVNEIINAVHAIKRKIEAIPKDDPMYANVGLSGVVGDLKSAVNRLTGAVPAHVCPYCKGNANGCKPCHGRGVISEFFWKTAVPTELKPEMPF